MKTLIISLMFGLTVFLLSAQEVTQLKETRLVYSPLQTQLIKKGDSYIYKVPAPSGADFAKDPIGFMNANFDIQKFMKEVSRENYDSYEVSFRSTHGSLVANFDRNGKLLQTRENFKNVVLPSDIRNYIYNNYQGWTVVGAKYTARTNGVTVANANYKVQLKNGKEKQNLKIDAQDRGLSVVIR